MARSRCRVGWWEFSARLFRYCDCRCSTDGITSRCATAQLRSWSVTSTRGDAHCLLRSLRKNRLAALASRRHETTMSRTLPSPVDGPPQILPTAVDRQEHLVEMPLVAGSGLAAAQAGRVFRPELGTPLPDRLVGDDHAADQHELLDLTEAQREAAIQPHAVRDDLRRIPVTLVRHLAHDDPPPAYRLRDHPLRPHQSPT